MRIAILCPVHRNPEGVADQIRNYASFHGDQAVHILHPSRGNYDLFAPLAARDDLGCQVFVNPTSWMTSYRSTFGAILSNAAYLDSLGDLGITHVYLHTDGDLLVAGDFLGTIARHGTGYSCAPIPDVWFNRRMMRYDERLTALRDRLGLAETDLRLSRQEGAFFDIALWRQIIDAVKDLFPAHVFDDVDRHWPSDEVIFPTLAHHFRNGVDPSVPNLIRIKIPRVKPAEARARGENLRDIDENLVQPFDLERALRRIGTDRCFGMKWFSSDPTHPGRVRAVDMRQRLEAPPTTRAATQPTTRAARRAARGL